ncbi:hypothetical protein [Sinomicrobium oceani]|uniref:hypothetical protein n=1 Tax=Sinomicrobium oceani TaxID=1150368 RepID=UPI00227AAA43|nr:hypothetical protein [Sinomicrobium oceani]
MKTLAIFCMGMACLAISCSPDHEMNIEPHVIRMEQSPDDPFGMSNNNGLAGQLYREFLALYGLEDISHWSLAEIDREVRSLFMEHGYELSASTHELPKDESIKSLLERSSLSAPARESFLEFLDALTASPPDDHILAYGSEVAQQATWTGEDRRVILTTISLIGLTDLTLYADEGDRDDEDWEVGTGNKSTHVVNLLENTVTVVILAAFYTSRYGIF